MSEIRVLILGAAGRDFHNFNVVYRDRPGYRVVAFTATQIPGIEGRTYPAELAGGRYPDGIPVRPEQPLGELIDELSIDEVVFAYSDVSHEHVMHIASRVGAAGADFRLLGGRRTMLAASVPVVAVCAVRTGCGKSQTSRYVAERLKEAGKRVVVARHPMPYGELTKQSAAQRFSSYDDLGRHGCTIEEREEYEAHIEEGTVVYAGIDYAAILEQAQAEADVLIWDGGNNDTPFYRPDLWITVVDPLRAGHESSYHPGETNLRAADVIVINKVSAAQHEHVDAVAQNAAASNQEAVIVEADSELSVPDPKEVLGKRVLTIDDGPTLTHGSMPYGAATVAAQQFGAAEIVDPRPFAVGTLGQIYRHGHLGNTVPAMGYSPEQTRDLERTIEAAHCDLVLYATPIDLGRLLTITKPVVRVGYKLADRDAPTLGEVVDGLVKKL